MNKPQPNTRSLILSAFGGLACFLGYRITFYPSAPKVDPDKKKIACVGDSITFGAGVLGRGRNKKSYPAVLQKCVGDSWQVLNYGLSDRTLLDEGNRPYRKEAFYPKSKAAAADIYILMLGTNDSKPFNWAPHHNRYGKELVSLIREYQSLPNHPKVYVMQPPRAFLRNNGKIAFEIDNDNIAVDIRHEIAMAAKETGASLIDLYTFTENHPEWFVDGVHPNVKGNREIAEFIAKKLVLE